MIGTINKIKKLSLITLSLCLLTAPLVMLDTQKVSAAAATFYNQPGDSRPDTQCSDGDFLLNPSIQFPPSDGGSRRLVYYCMNMPTDSVTLNNSTLRPAGGSCAFGYGGLDAGGFGFHCIPNNINDTNFYSGGTPVLDNSGGGSYNNTPQEQPSYVKNDCNGPDIKAGEPKGSENHCGILDYLVIFINALSALVGILVVGSIIYGGIQYSMAGSDPQKVAASKERIRNAIIALIFFLFAYSFLNYLVPGGVL